MANGPIRRKTEKAVRDNAGVPVGLLFDEGNDVTVMQRGTANGDGKVTIVDETTGVPLDIQLDGSIDVNVQDQASRAFDIFFAQDVGSPTTLTIDAVQDAYTVSVTTGHGLIAGDTIVMADPTIEKGYTGIVVSVAGDNTVNLDMPLNVAFTAAGTIVQERTHNLNVDGSVTRQSFKVGSPLTGTLDITRIMFQITTTDAATFDLFGDQTALAGGVLLRIVKNGDRTNLWNLKTNGEMAGLMYDVEFFSAAHPLALNGLAGRLTYGGQAKHGVVLRISGGEYLEIVVQDNLAALLSFHIIACGHLVVGTS